MITALLVALFLLSLVGTVYAGRKARIAERRATPWYGRVEAAPVAYVCTFCGMRRERDAVECPRCGTC